MRVSERLRSWGLRLLPVLGLLAILAYWLHLDPGVRGLIGYSDDLGTIEIPRQLMAESLKLYGRPHFFTSKMMAPFGINSAFFPWAMERDWIGAYLWMWNRDFPWLWVYFGLSMAISFLGVGWLSRKIGLPRGAAWCLALVAVLFNVPRHYKVYYHYEHLIHHWVYLAAFLDVWIWKRFWQERKWSLKLEAWRVFLVIATLGLAGYYWGGMILEWVIVRAFMVVVDRKREKRGLSTEIEGSWRDCRVPLALSAVWSVFVGLWFVPLFREYLAFGKVPQASGWTASWWMVFRPLWIDPLFPAFRGWLPIDQSETVVTIGWTFCIPVLLSVYWFRKRSISREGLSGPGLAMLGPFLLWFTLAVLYVHGGWLYFVQSYIRHLIPFMGYFRVASRMGIFLPIIASAIVALAWPELSRRVRPLHWVPKLLFVAMVGLELTSLGDPVVKSPPVTPELVTLMSQIRALPGNEVLDLPFCAMGGNAVCQEQQCPLGYGSVAPSHLMGWHGKAVYGVYESRLSPKQCSIYNRAPFTAWFSVWKKERCFNEAEWDQFCEYLRQRSQLSAVLVYPGIWKAASNPACRAEFDRHLGSPLGEARMGTGFTRGGENIPESPVLWYSAKCR